MNPLYRPSTHRNPSKDIFRPSLRSVVPKGVEERREEGGGGARAKQPG